MFVLSLSCQQLRMAAAARVRNAIYGQFSVNGRELLCAVADRAGGERRENSVSVVVVDKPIVYRPSNLTLSPAAHATRTSCAGSKRLQMKTPLLPAPPT